MDLINGPLESSQKAMTVRINFSLGEFTFTDFCDAMYEMFDRDDILLTKCGSQGIIVSRNENAETLLLLKYSNVPLVDCRIL